MAGFIKKKVQSFTLGEKLKKIREKAGFSLAEVANFTKVKQSHLQKIEDGDFENLPPDVYVRGFLKSYAKFLRLDPEEIIKYYEREAGVYENIKKYQSPIQEKKRNYFPKIIITPKVFTAFFIGLFILAGFSYFYFEIEKFSQNPRLVVLHPSGEGVVHKSSLEVVGITDNENKVSINGQPVRTNESGEFKETLGLRKGVNEIIVKAENKLGKETLEILKVSADFQVTSVKGDSSSMEDRSGSESQENKDKEKKDDENFNFSISAQDEPVWISVEVDGKKKQDGTMLAGSVQSFEVGNQIRVTSGKANKTIIRIGEKEMGKLADHSGVERGVVFDRNGRVKDNQNEEEKQISGEEIKKEKRES
jgi:cytoskeletal protein RodZ